MSILLYYEGQLSGPEGHGGVEVQVEVQVCVIQKHLDRPVGHDAAADGHLLPPLDGGDQFSSYELHNIFCMSNFKSIMVKSETFY